MLLASVTYGQTIGFGYDDAGNRESRTLTIEKITEANDSGQTQESDDSFDIFKSVTIDDVKVIVSPNPNEGRFSIRFINLTEGIQPRVLLHSMSGKPVFENENQQSLINVDVSDRENGTYILTIIINGKKEAWKVIKQ